MSSLDERCPTKNFNVKTVKFPWVNRDALEIIRDRNSALSRAKRTNKKEDWDTAKQLRNRIGLAIQNMRRDYIEDEQRANQGNQKKFLINLKIVVPGKNKQTEKIDSRMGRQY